MIPVIALVATFAIDLGFELSGPYIPQGIYNICILRYLAALGLGFYIAPELLSRGKLNLMDRRFGFIVPLAVVSAVLRVLHNGSSFPLFRREWGMQNLLSSFYPTFLVIIIFNLYSHISRIELRRILELAGRASYHIFLVQMLCFGFVFSGLNTAVKTMPLYGAWPIVIATSLGMNIILGIIFYWTEGELREKPGEKCCRT